MKIPKNIRDMISGKHAGSKSRSWLDSRIQAQEKFWADSYLKSKKEAAEKRWIRDSLWSGDYPLRFTFDRWKPERQEDKKQAREIGVRAWELADRVIKGDEFNALMTGEPGTGKTSLALAIAWKAWKVGGKNFLFISTMELVGLFSERFDNPEVGIRLKELQKLAKKAPVLILDDFGTEAGMKDQSGYFKPVRKDMQEWLYQVANARYEEFTNSHKGVTIITTNNTSGDLMQMYNPKLISRLITKKLENTIIFDGLDDMRG